MNKKLFKKTGIALMVMALLTGFLVSESSAGGWGHYYGHWWGGPGIYIDPWPLLGYYPPYYPSYYYASPPVVVQQQPSVYVQQRPADTNYWYYCENPKGYYPYVRECPCGWLKVAPQPAPPRP